MAQSNSDDYELVDFLTVAKQIVSDKKPDLSKIRAWLSPTDYTASSSEYRRHLSSQAPGTGEWIRETSQFEQWYSSDDHGSIWVSKQYQIIETNRTSRALLRDWLAQLLLTSEILQVALWDIVEDKKDLETISTEQLWKFLLSALRSAHKVYCIVDALDEMNLDEEFLSQLDAMGSFKPANVKVLMTSWPKQYLQRAMRDPQVIHVSLEEELVKRDISVFVQQRVSQLRNISLESQKFIGATVCDRSQGLFLYARLMLDQVAQSIEAEHLNEAVAREMVAKLPIGLEEMPLRLIEIAKGIEADQRQLGRDSKDIVRTACGPLLEIMEDEVVQILHHSFTEFLLDVDRLASRTSQFPVIDPETANRSIAMTCLVRLQGDALNDYEKDINENPDWRHGTYDFRSIFLQFPLVEYAAKKWPYHAKQGSQDTALFASLGQFCDLEKPYFSAWLQLMSQQYDIAPRGVTPLHVTAAFSLTSWVKHLIESEAGLNVLDSTKNTALFWASKSGHNHIVDLLIKAGAKPNVDGYNGLKPLHEAASRNHSNVVKLLLAAGVSPTTPKTSDISGRCGNRATTVGHSPLRYASQRGHVESVVEMIPYITQTEHLNDTLCWAAQGGHSKLLEAIFRQVECFGRWKSSMILSP